MNAASVSAAVADFGAAAKPKLAAGGQPEDQLRNPLENLLHALALAAGLPAGALTLAGETTLAGRGVRPDFAVHIHKALTGFIEVKAPGKGADPRKFRDPHDKAQWEKLKSLPNLLYTDGNAFSLWRDGRLIDSIVHLDGDIETSGAKLRAPPTLLARLDDFFRWRPIPPDGPGQLAETAARLCRYLRDEVVGQLQAKNPALAALKEDWRALLFPDADDARFADGYAQAVTFGLLMARSKGIDLAPGIDSAARALGRTDTLIGTALRLLTEQDFGLGPSVATLVRVLDAVDWNKVSKGDPEAWLYFYENFLTVYDPVLRRQSGSYYTPPEVVRAMVRLADEALRSASRFAAPAGLAAPHVHLVDPATGSGTFLLEAVRTVAARIESIDGPGAVPAALAAAAGRMHGLELQFGAYAVAELRLAAEMASLGADGAPRLYVADTLADPYAAGETGQGIYREISKSRAAAAAVKREQVVTVVIGNPPYKERAKGRGGWIESGSNRAAPFLDWVPPKAWKVGAHAKHLRNLYLYFWRWAAWKVFEQGSGGQHRVPPQPEHLSGLVCYITAAGFLNGPGFAKMRADLRRDCDDIWVIDCTPEGHQPKVNTRIFQGVQQPVCIVLAARSPANDPAQPARVRHRALPAGPRAAKFEALETVALDGPGWADAAADWRAPFLPASGAAWSELIPLDHVLGDCGSGVMPGRTWVIAPDKETLAERWAAIGEAGDLHAKEKLFHPQLRGGKLASRHVSKVVSQPLGNIATRPVSVLNDRGPVVEPVRYAFRSFDRQWLPADARLVNDTRPDLWAAYGSSQVFMTGLMASSPRSGPAVTLTALIPDQDHYKGSFGGRVFALWRDSAATVPNIAPAVLATLTRLYGRPVAGPEVFAYTAALLASPAYTARFLADLAQPGLRVPLTASERLFTEAAALGREVIRLHTFNERFTEAPAGPPRADPPVANTVPIATNSFPDALHYDPATRTLRVGDDPAAGLFSPVPPAVWAYEISGKNVLRQWFSYRRRDRERPQIGDKRPPSPLCDIQPAHWLPEYTSELVSLLNTLALVTALEPAQADVLDRILAAPLVPAGRFPDPAPRPEKAKAAEKSRRRRRP